MLLGQYVNFVNYVVIFFLTLCGSIQKFAGEFKNFGAGARFDRRVYWATLITDPAVATKFTVIFISGAEWLPQVKVDFQPQL